MITVLVSIVATQNHIRALLFMSCPMSCAPSYKPSSSPHPSRCPEPLVFHESGRTEPVEAPVLRPASPDPGPDPTGRTAVPYSRWNILGVVTRRDMNFGVESRFGPPPNSGHRRVKKSYKWAAIMPVSCSGTAAGEPDETIVARMMQYGTVCAGTWKKKKVIFTPRRSCTPV